MLAFLELLVEDHVFLHVLEAPLLQVVDLPLEVVQFPVHSLGFVLFVLFQDGRRQFILHKTLGVTQSIMGGRTNTSQDLGHLLLEHVVDGGEDSGLVVGLHLRLAFPAASLALLIRLVVVLITWQINH